jgi:methyl-accepting chemotaxis protein
MREKMKHLIEKIQPENIYYTLLIAGMFASLITAGAVQYNTIISDIKGISKQVGQNSDDLKTLNQITSSIDQIEKRVDQNSSLLAQGGRYTVQDHREYKAEVNMRFNQVDQRFTEMMTTVERSNRAVLERLTSIEEHLRNGNH